MLASAAPDDTEEELGVHGDVIVQRTKKAAGRRKHESGSSDDLALDPVSVCPEIMTPVDDSLLTSIREGMLIFSRNFTFV